MMRSALGFLVCLVLGPALATAHHSGSSPVHPAADNDARFEVDQSPGLDTGCTFRSGGPLVVELDVDRFYGATVGPGQLNRRDSLINAGLLAEEAILRMPAFDVDRNTNPGGGRQPEIDHVFINDRFVGTLTGENNTWVMNEFRVPIRDIFFPDRGSLGQMPNPKTNTIRIDIDTANSEEVWCTAIDWMQLEIQAINPIVMVHGINSGPSAWTDFRVQMDNLGQPFDRDVQLGRNRPVDENAQELQEILPDIAESFGVRGLHVAAHSKGGLEMRRFLSLGGGGGVEILSLHTYSTPHHGSILADISVLNRTNPDARSRDPDIQEYLERDDNLLLSALGPKRPGLDDLTIGAARAFNLVNGGVGGPRFYTYGADADVDDDGNISIGEVQGFVGLCTVAGTIPPISRACVRAANIVYRVLRDVAEVQAIPRRDPPSGLRRWTEIQVVQSTNQQNDLAVTDASSRFGGIHDGPLDANHGNIKNRDRGEELLETLARDFPVQ